MGFVDIHSHVLFGLDDGARNIDEAIAMLEMAVAHGTTDLICTPHYKLFLKENTPRITQRKFQELKQAAKHLPINLYLGHEMRFNTASVAAIKKQNFNTLNNSQYLLIDFPFTNNHINPLGTVKELIDLHPHFIIGHPERHTDIRSVKLIEQIKDLGILIQVNVGSILGLHGHHSQLFAFELLDHNLVDFVASDGHNTSTRPPVLSEGYEIIKEHYGIHRAQLLFEDNARQLLLR